MFKVSNYVGLKKMLAVGTKQEIMVLELTGFSDELDREGDVGLKALKLVIDLQHVMKFPWDCSCHHTSERLV